MSFSSFSKMLLLLGEKTSMIPAIIVASLFVSFLDLFGIALIGPFISLTLLGEGGNNQFISFLTNFTGATSYSEILTIFGIALIATFIFKNFFAWLLQAWIISYVYEAEKSLRLKISRILLDMNLLTINSSDSSHHINVTTRHINMFANQILYASLKLFSEGIAIFLIVSFLIYLYPAQSLVILAILVLSSLIYFILAGNTLKLAGENAANANSNIINIMTNLISGIREIRVYALEDFFQSLLNKQSQKHKDAYYQYTTKQLIPRYMIETILMAVLVSLAIFMSWSGYDQASIISMIGVMAVAAIRMMPGIIVFTNSANNIINGQVVLDELFSLYKRISKDQNHLKNNLENKTSDFNEFNQLVLKDVTFKYPQSDRPSLENLDFKIDRGESIGLVGKSGSGKTTLINIILGFIKVSSGKVYINGRDMDSVNYSSWLSTLSYIPQDKFLINDSIQSNIALGIEKDNIDQSHLNNVINLANLEDLIASAPDGKNFVIGENGNKLSGGQRQRICLARAFYFNRELIILDEATSSLDEETESQVMNEIHALKGTKTFIIISHKPSTLLGCDRVLEVNNGQLIES